MILLVKTVHSLLLLLVCAAVGTILISAWRGRTTRWTRWAVGIVLAEGLALAASGWRCPLTRLAESLGAERGSVAYLFMPDWLARRIFPLCGALFLLGCLGLLARCRGERGSDGRARGSPLHPGRSEGMLLEDQGEHRVGENLGSGGAPGGCPGGDDPP